MSGLMAAISSLHALGRGEGGGPRQLIQQQRNWRVIGILFLIAAEAILYGFSYPFFSLALEKQDLAGWLIGLNASLAGAGILVVGPFLPRLIRAFGLKHLVAGFFALSLVSFAALIVVDQIIIWFLARLVMGACFAALWTTTEIWLNGVVDDQHRGRIIGASATLYAGAQFLGPLALSATGATGHLPLIAAMVPLAMGIVVALSISSPKRVESDRSTHIGQADLRLALRLVGPLIAAAFFAGVAKVSMQSLLPLFGLAHGLDDSGAARLVAVLSLGEAVLVGLVGFMADRFGRSRTLRLSGLGALIVMVLLPIAVRSPALLTPTLFIAGSVISGIYTLGVIQIGQDYRGHQLVVVSTAFAMAYAAGAVIGSTPFGLAIDLFGPNALPYGLAISFAALASLVFVKAASEKYSTTSSGLNSRVPPAISPR